MLLLLLTLSISIISLHSQNCGFTDYQSTIIENPYQVQSFSIYQQNPYGVGLWTKYIAYDELNSEFYLIPETAQYLDKYASQQLAQVVRGKQLLTIQDTSTGDFEINMILTLHSIDSSITVHRLYYKQSYGELSFLELQYNTGFYEGYWIFTYIGIFPDAQLFQFLSFGYAQYDSGWIWGGNKLIQNSYFTAITGGYGEYLFEGYSLTLDRFLGKFSKSILIYEFFWDPQSLRNFLTAYQCNAYNQCQGLVIDNFINSMEFDGTNDVTFSKFVSGNQYLITFWLKLNYQKVVRTSEMLVLRATTNPFYGNNTKLGDRSFLIKYLIDFPDNGTIMTLSSYHYSIPNINTDYTLENFNELQVVEKAWLTQASQYWHRIKYYQEYYQGEQYIEFYYPFVQMNYYANLNTQYYRQLLNTMMYFHIGVDYYQYTQKLQGSIADFKFYSCIEGNSLDNIEKDCDNRCSQCSGPTQYDCLNCTQGSNRFNLIYNTTCQCLNGYIDIQIDVECKQFNQIYNIIEESEIQESLHTQSIKCPFSKLQKNRIGCLDCLQNQNFWQTKPICTSDLLQYKITNTYSPYYISNRNELFFDVYIVENDLPQLCVGCLAICDDNEDCQLSTYGLQIKCKQNYYFLDGDCKECPNQCKSCSSNGECQECFDSYYLDPNDISCYECQQNCKGCSYSIVTNKPICTSCYDKQSLFEGQCYNCGTHCSICEFKNYLLGDTEVLFNRCIKCDEPGKYFRSLDGTNCQVNQIPNCLDAFEYQSVNEQSIDFKFLPYAVDDKTQIICARCDYGYIYDFYSKTCTYYNSEKGKSFVLDYQTGEIIIISGYSSNGQNMPQPYELLQDCVLNGEPLQYCRHCIYSNTYKIRRCSLCDSGYYAERLRGICLVCQIKNCRICTQQMKIYQDARIWQIKAFYEYFINHKGDHGFEEYAQSQQEEDYEVVCTLCYEGYETINGKCVKKCHKTCQSCELINDEYYCLQCFTNQQGQALTIVNNECIECPFNCALCTIRSDRDVHMINPYFQNSAYKYFSYLCLLPYTGLENYYYDDFLGQYIKCDKYQSCYKSWKIERNLICLDSVYDSQYSLLTSKNDQEQYAFKNKKLSELFSNTQYKSHLSEFENDLIYLQANQQGIKQIILRYYLDAQEGCVLTQNAYYAQYFSYNIFSALNVDFELIGRNNPSITFYGDFKIINFTSILISNITIYSNKNINKINYFQFSSLNWLFLQLINISFIQIENNTFQLIYNNISSLNMTNIIFQVNNKNVNLDNNYLIYFQSSQSINIQQNYIVFNQIKFNKCIFWKSEFIFYNSTLPILFRNSEINSSQFNQFTFFNISNSNLILQNLEIVNTIITNSNFILMNKNSIFNLSNISITSTQIQNSIWLSASQQTFISNLKLNDIIFSANSIFIELINSINKSINFLLYQSDFQNIQYLNQSKLLRIQDNLQISTSFINLTQIILQNNTNLLQIQSQDNVIQYFNSLIIINSTKVNINQIIINRGIGINEFALINIQTLTINNLIASLMDSYRIKSLHQYLDCLEDQIYENKFGTMIYIIRGQDTILENIQIHNLIIVDEPLIQFLSQVNYMEPKQETIIVKSGILYSNLLLITKLTKTVSIIYIESMQLVNIEISQIEIIKNHFNSYISEQDSISTSTLTINCPQCNLNMVQINLSQNLNTNSTNQIMIIKVQNLSFLNSQVNENNQITVNFILPNLYKGFANNIITLSNKKIKNLFPVISYGTFQFSVQRLQINNIQLSSSFGSRGTCFTILAEKQGIIQISNSTFNNITDGGCFYIDSTPTNLNLKINNILFETIFNSQEGGAISIRPTGYSAIISIFNITILDTYAISGSLLNSQFIYSLQEKIVQIDNINIQDKQQNFYDYLLIFTDFTSSIQELLTNTYIINIKNSNQVNITNIFVKNMKSPRVFNIIEGTITIFNVSIIDTDNVIEGFFIKQSNLLDKLYLRKIYIRNQTSYYNQNNLANCEYSFIVQPLMHMICIENSQLSISIDQQREDTDLILLRQCRAQIFTNQILKLNSYITIERTIKSNNTLLSDIIYLHNNVSQFTNGLIYLKIVEQEIILENMNFENNICAFYGCLCIEKYNSSTNNRLLQQTVNQVVEVIPLKIQQMNCINNYAINGVCIYVLQLSVLIENSLFVQNIAQQFGGAIYIEGNNQIFLIENYINKNQAQIGGAIYISQGQIQSEILKMNIIDENIGTISNNNVFQYPSQVVVQLKLNETYIGSKRLFSNQSFTVDQIDYHQIGTKQYVKMPSGIEIDNYVLYNQTDQQYSNSVLCFALFVTDQFSNVMFTTKESECKLKSRKIIIGKEVSTDVDFQDEKLASPQSVNFDPNTNNYDFGKLIILFDPDSNQNEVLQLQFQCDTILVAQYKESNQYESYGYSNNYYYRINVKTLPCQIGEIKNDTTLSCQTCDSAAGFFQVKYNQSQCQLMDNGLMLNNTSSNYQLRTGFWRESYDNIILDQCSNNLDNCLGGWNFSDSSCFLGHIGALCEECDLYNTRGQGQFAMHQKYSCGTCNTIGTNILIWLAVSVWTLVSVGITVKATFDFGYSLRVNRHIMRIALLIANENCQGGILIKFLSTYLQIVGSLSTFQLSLPSVFSSIMDTTANPIQTVIYSLDCFLANVLRLEIVYSRILWQMMMPLIYIVLFFIGFAIILRDKVILMKNGLIITGMIYIYIFLQPNLIGSIISVIAFRVVDGYRWIQGHMAYRYDTDYHYHILYFLFGMVFIIGILIPLTLLYKLFKNSNNLNSLVIRNLYGYLYNEYIDKAYFWELVKLGLKDLIILCLTFYQDYIFLKAVIIYLMLQIYILLSQHYKPHRLNFLNLLDHEMCLNCQISIIIGFGLSLIQKQQINQAEVPFILILGVTNCLFLYKILSKLFEAYLIKFQVYIDLFKEKIKKSFPRINSYRICRISLQNRTAAKTRAKQNFRKLYHVMMTIKGLNSHNRLQTLATEA